MATRHTATYQRTVAYSNEWAVMCYDCPERCLAVVDSQSEAMVKAHAHGKRGRAVMNGPFRTCTKVINALCEDSGRRTAYIVGAPDTFFSQPAYMYVSGKKVSGFVTRNDDDDWWFIAYEYGKNSWLLKPTKERA